MPRRLILLTLLALLVLLAYCTPSLAIPGPRYASPTGTSAQGCSTPATACDIATAIDGSGANNPVAGQEVIVEPGTYTLSASLTPSVNTIIHGVDGQPRPVIKATGFSALYPSGAFALQISYVEIDVNVSGNEGINTSGATFDRVLINGASSNGNICQCYDGTIRNSVIVNTGAGGAAWGLNSNGGTSTEILRNDTFVATQVGAYAMWMDQTGSPALATIIDAKNVIALNTAGGHDVYSFGPMATIAMAYSDFAHSLTGNGGTISSGGHNISTAPVFVDQNGGDFRERLSSPTIDAGVDDTANDGTLDFAGGPRMTGSHTDIGAFEYQPAAAIAAASGSPQSTVVGSAFAGPLSAKVTDAQGNPVFGMSVTFAVPNTAAGTFAGAASVQATTGADGVATAPTPLTAGHHAGGFSVTASTAGVATAAALPLTNLPGPAASLSLTPAASTVAAGAAQGYSAELLDAYGNDAGPAGAGTRLTIAPDGSCVALGCTALVPRAHTVTATLGALTATASLTVGTVPPHFAFGVKSLAVAHRSRRGNVTAVCNGPTGEVCSITGTVTIRRHRRQLKLGTISGRVGSGTRGTVSLLIGKRIVRGLRGHTVRANVVLTVVDLSGRATVHAQISLKLR